MLDAPSNVHVKLQDTSAQRSLCSTAQTHRTPPPMLNNTYMHTSSRWIRVGTCVRGEARRRVPSDAGHGQAHLTYQVVVKFTCVRGEARRQVSSDAGHGQAGPAVARQQQAPYHAQAALPRDQHLQQLPTGLRVLRSRIKF
jgi:hypothetical protein